MEEEKDDVNEVSVVLGIAEMAIDEEVSDTVRLRAYELLGRHLGLFSEKKEKAAGVVTIAGEDEIRE